MFDHLCWRVSAHIFFPFSYFNNLAQSQCLQMARRYPLASPPTHPFPLPSAFAIHRCDHTLLSPLQNFLKEFPTNLTFLTYYIFLSLLKPPHLKVINHLLTKADALSLALILDVFSANFDAEEGTFLPGAQVFLSSAFLDLLLPLHGPFSVSILFSTSVDITWLPFLGLPLPSFVILWGGKCLIGLKPSVLVSQGYQTSCHSLDGLK